MSPSRHPIGVPSSLFRGSPATVAGACLRLGVSCVRLAPGFPGLPFLDPAHFTPERCRAAAGPFLDAGVSVACLAAGGNLMDAHLSRRQRTVQRLHALLRHARDFGTAYVVTETGTLSPDGRRGPYAPNRTASAWEELRLILGLALEVAAGHGTTLLLRAEPGHVLATSADVLRLAAEVDDPRLGFVMDPAVALLGRPREEWPDALARLVEGIGPRAPVVYAKDVRLEDDGVTLPRAELGGLDYPLFLRLLDRYQPTAPIIMEHLRPEDVEATRRYLEECMSPV
jgi:sugar phosphate isomerase/epimerase